MLGIVLAAGNGTRLSATTGRPVCKALERFAGSYLIEYALNNLIDLGLTEAIIVVGKQGDLIKQIIGNSYKSLNLIYTTQTQQKGLINALSHTFPFIYNEGVILQLADEILVEPQIDTIKNFLDTMNNDFYCGFTYDEDTNKIKNNFSIESDNEGFIKKCIEKPSVVTNTIKGTGFCIFNKDSFEILKTIYNEEANTPFDLCDYINHLVNEGKKGVAFCVAEQEFNINTLSDLNSAYNYLQTKSGEN